MRRPLWIAAVVACLLCAAPGNAATTARPQITDQVGDAIALGPSYDVVSATFRTAGRRQGRRYVPTTLVVTVTYAAPPETTSPAIQAVVFDVPRCGRVFLETFDGRTFGEADCLPGVELKFPASISGTRITMTLPFATLGTTYLKPGVRLTSLRTYTSVGEPVFGFDPAGLANTYAYPVLAATGAHPSPPDQVSVDYATTDLSYVVM